MKSATITAGLTDGRVLTVKTVMRDIISYENTAKKQKPPWGGISDNPARWESFVTWTALRRTGQIDMPYEAFVDEITEIEFDFDDVTPTNGASTATS